MDLDLLLQDFDEIIIERGKAYFEERRVTELEEVSPGEFAATVEGSEDYSVTVTLHDDQSAEFTCDCPYSNAPYCKHTVAVLFAIKKRRPRAKSKETGRQSVKNPLSTEELRKLSSDLLVSLLQEAAGEFPEVNSWLRARISPKEDDLKAYRKLIRSSIRSHMEQGFVSYRQMHAALRGAQTALEYLQALADADSVKQTLAFALMVIEEVMKLTECGDDSDGEVGGLIEGCLECIGTLYENRVSLQDEAEQTEFFHLLLAAAKSPLFQGWTQWNEYLIGLCVSIADRFASLRPHLMALREHDMEANLNKEDYSGRYAGANAQKACYELLKRWEGEESALRFASSHMENDDLRLQVFLSFREKQRFAEALALCLEGEKKAGSYHGTATRWKERRYEIYELMKNRDSQKKLGEELVLDGGKDYYAKLKLLYPADQWPEKRENLLERLQSGANLHSTYLQIITEEEDRPRILAYVQKFSYNIFSLYAYLLPDYTDEVQLLFRKALLQSASVASDRKAYHGVCAQIAIYGHACGEALAKEIIREVQAAYPRKPAFQEELGEAMAKIRRGASK